MRNLILLSVALIINCLNLLAGVDDEYTYSKLFEEGKTWVIVENWIDVESKEPITVHKRITKETDWSYEGHTLTKVNIFNIETSESHIESLLEENGILYTFSYGGCRKLIDFNLHKGDEVLIGYQDEEDVTFTSYVVNDEIINIKGINRRIISIGHEIDSTPVTYWIEGIGAIDDYVMSLFPQPTSYKFLQNRYIESCYIDNRCIFSYEDFISNSGIMSQFGKDVDNCYLSYGNNSITINGHSGDVMVKIYLNDGTLCMAEKSVNHEALSTSNLPSGLYIATAISQNGNCKSIKFIKRQH